MQVLDLIRTENKICNKIVTVFAALCCECKFLVHECERKYLPAILFFGEGGTSRTAALNRNARRTLIRRTRSQRPTADLHGTIHLSSPGWHSLSLLLHLRHAFRLVKDLSCFVNRCSEVVANILQQLSALYTPSGLQNGR